MIRYAPKPYTIGVFALLHQAKTKTGDEAERLYQDAISKFFILYDYKTPTTWGQQSTAELPTWI